MKIALDIGHGQDNRKVGVFDPGAVGNRTTEHEQAKAIVAMLSRVLGSMGHSVFIPSGIYTTRQTQADKWGAQLYLSIHLNAATAQATGTETFVHPQAGPTARRLAIAVQAAAVDSLGLPNRGVKEYGFAVLSGKVPAALLEVCFISNAGDVATLNEKRALLVSELAKAIKLIAGGSEPVTANPRYFALAIDCQNPENGLAVAAYCSGIGVGSVLAGSTVLCHANEDKARQIFAWVTGRRLDVASIEVSRASVGSLKLGAPRPR